MSTLDALRESATAQLMGLRAHEVGFSKLPGSGDTDAVHLSDQEQEILALYDRLAEMELHAALLRAHQTVVKGELLWAWDLIMSNAEDPSDTSHTPSSTDLQAAQRELLEAKASYSLRNNVIENVMITDPILKAVHSGTNASVAERYDGHRTALARSN